ncbi:MAG: type III pantothenate kinase [Saprospiraceae bacterium]
MDLNTLNLIVDIGNTRSKLALFKGSKLLKKEFVTDLSVDDLIHFTTNQNIGKAIFSNTGNLPIAIKEFANSAFNPIWMSHELGLPIKMDYHTPHTLGKDRIAAVTGAFEKFPGKNCLVIDAGTCITYDWLTKEGRYLGGNIAPGLTMRLRAMHEFTAALPLVEPGAVSDPIGKSTQEALKNGAVWGTFKEIEGYIDWGIEKFEDLSVVFTGGDTDFFVRNIKREIFADLDLVLTGLNKILKFND